MVNLEVNYGQYSVKHGLNSVKHGYISVKHGLNSVKHGQIHGSHGPLMPHGPHMPHGPQYTTVFYTPRFSYVTSGTAVSVSSCMRYWVR